MNWTITFGDILTSVAVAVSVASLAYAMVRGNRDRRRTEAQRIRTAAGQTVAKLERWVDLALSTFDAVQPAFVDADAALVRDENPERIRDDLWSASWIGRQTAQQAIMGEELELAYADLYGYDERVHDLYRQCVDRLKAIEATSLDLLLHGTQNVVLSTGSRRQHRPSALGNKLRAITGAVQQASQRDYEGVIGEFRSQMSALLRADDASIVKRSALGPSFGRLPEPRRDNVDRLKDAGLSATHEASCRFCSTSSTKGEVDLAQIYMDLAPTPDDDRGVCLNLFEVLFNQASELSPLTDTERCRIDSAHQDMTDTAIES